MDVLELSVQILIATATLIVALATLGLYYVAKRALPDHQKQVNDFRAACLQMDLSSSCVNVREAHDQFPNFPNVDDCPEGQSSHFYVKSNDVLLGRKFSLCSGSTSPEDWCYIGVFLKNEQKKDAFTDIVLRLVVNQNEKEWVFYGHKDQLKFETRTDAIYSTGPYSQDYRIPVIRPEKGKDFRFLGVIKIRKQAELVDRWDKVFTYKLLYRVSGAATPVDDGEISIAEKLREFREHQT